MRSFLPARITDMRREGMIEGLAVDVLGMRRKVRLHRSRQVAVVAWPLTYNGADHLKKWPPTFEGVAAA